MDPRSKTREPCKICFQMMISLNFCLFTVELRLEKSKITNKQTTVMILITLANEDDGRWRLGWEISLGARIDIHWKKNRGGKNISTSEKFNKKNRHKHHHSKVKICLSVPAWMSEFEVSCKRTIENYHSLWSLCCCSEQKRVRLSVAKGNNHKIITRRKN